MTIRPPAGRIESRGNVTVASKSDRDQVERSTEVLPTFASSTNSLSRAAFAYTRVIRTPSEGPEKETAGDGGGGSRSAVAAVGGRQLDATRMMRAAMDPRHRRASRTFPRVGLQGHQESAYTHVTGHADRPRRVGAR